MRFELPNGLSGWLIGDPHRGRQFQTGVLPTKRGQRELRQRHKLQAELNTKGVDYIIAVGDEFDHPNVGYKVVVEAAKDWIRAARTNPDVTYVVMAGNHDLPRNITSIGAFDAFEKSVSSRLDNLLVARKPMTLGNMFLFPWEWGVSAEDQLLAVDEDDEVTTAIGHWDLQSYGGDDSHLCPAESLHEMGVTEIYSGHYHVEGKHTVSGHVVHCTGSMEPYSHGEDPEGEIYVTLSLEEALDGRDLTDKVVRVVLAEGEELPAELDCMALTAIKDRPAQEEEYQNPLQKFEWKTVLEDALADLDPEVRTFIEERLTA